MINHDDPRIQALWRFRDRALEQAATILALVRSSKTDREPLYGLHDRQIIQLSTLLHDFSFNTRKAIELAEREQPGVVQAAKTARLKSAGTTLQPDDGDIRSITLTAESFWWIICRLVHSTDTVVGQTSETDVDYRGRIRSKFMPRFFGFQSDLDSGPTSHYISVEDFLECYVVYIDPLIARAYGTRMA